MKPEDCPQCNPAQLALGYPHPRFLVEGLLEMESYPIRSGFNSSLEACVCLSCGRVQLFHHRRRDVFSGRPLDWKTWGKAI